MIRGYLLDEHLPKWWRRQFVSHAPALKVWRVGDSGAPPLQSPDPMLLEWCEAHECILLTNNRKSMPRHLAEHLRQGRHIPGIFQVEARMNVAHLAEALVLIAGASFENEYQDQINYFPLL
jgi:hypothetical protein